MGAASRVERDAGVVVIVVAVVYVVVVVHLSLLFVDFHAQPHAAFVVVEVR